MTHIVDTDAVETKPCPQCDSFMLLEIQRVNHKGACQIWGCPSCRRLEVHSVEMHNTQPKQFT